MFGAIRSYYYSLLESYLNYVKRLFSNSCRMGLSNGPMGRDVGGLSDSDGGGHHGNVPSNLIRPNTTISLPFRRLIPSRFATVCENSILTQCQGMNLCWDG
jgi:hypothetical protein